MKIVVVCGGVTGEREVSLRSGEAVAAALREAGMEPLVYDAQSVSAFLTRWPEFGADGVFVALHGGWGEDGRIQAVMEANGIPYTGSGARACWLAMDKNVARARFAEGGVAVAPGFAVTCADKPDLADAVRRWGKIVVKPANGGSTVGVTIATDARTAEMGLAAVWDTDTAAVVEAYISGREVTVAVFGNGDDAFAMPIVEICPKSGFYDYGSKYTSGASEYLCPAPFDPEIAKRIETYALTAYRLLGCATYARIDFRVTESGEIYALEANTAPGMTATSLVPKAAAAYGWSFPELLRRIVTDSFGLRR